MRKIFIYSAVVISALLLAGCKKDKDSSTWSHAGEVIQFTTSSSSSNDTKTVYSGEVVEGSERIDWIDGDMIAIYCDEAGTNKEADYSIIASSIKANGKISESNITSDSPLVWGEKESYDFYALYPSPAIADELGSVTGGVTADLDGNTVKVYIPATQDQTKDNKGRLAADPMHYAYMVAANTNYTPKEGSDNLIELLFKPIVTTFQVTIINNYADNKDMQLYSVRLKSNDATQYITGTVTGTITSSDDVTFSYSGGSNYVNASFMDANMQPKTLKNGESCVITFFTRPTDISALNLEIVTNLGRRKLALKDKTTSEYITFGAKKKHNLNNVKVPSKDFKWSVPTMLILWSTLNKLYPEEYSYAVWNGGGFYKNGVELSDDEIEALFSECVNLICNKEQYLLQDIDYDDLKWFTNAENIDFVSPNINNENGNIVVEFMNKLRTFKLYSNSAVVKVNNCDALEHIEVTTSSTGKDYEFTDLKSLKYLYVKASSGLDNLTLSNCPALEEIYLDDVTKLTSLNFSDFPSLKKITIKSAGSLETLEFSNCPNLEEISVTGAAKLTDFAMNGFENLKKVEIEDAQVMKTLSFKNCSSLEEISVTNAYVLDSFEATNNDALKTVSLTNTQNITNIYVEDCKSMTSFTTTNAGTTAISKVYFNNCQALETMTIGGWGSYDAIGSVTITNCNDNGTYTIFNTTVANGTTK